MDIYEAPGGGGEGQAQLQLQAWRVRLVGRGGLDSTGYGSQAGGINWGASPCDHAIELKVERVSAEGSEEFILSTSSHALQSRGDELHALPRTK